MNQTNPGTTDSAVMPNGEVALILDVRTLLQLARRDYKMQQLANLAAVNAAADKPVIGNIRNNNVH